MGVPCVTLRGKGHAQNVGVSLLGAIGMQEGWVASTEEEYVDLAVRRYLVILSRGRSWPIHPPTLL
jgi:predicted O-linked N-acetylglucosamine transferase (SPINDLY family)